MWTISQMICLGGLAGLSVTDIYYRKIPTEMLVMGAVGTLIYQLFFRRESLWVLGGGIVVGIVFLFISRLTREGIGYGDSIAIFILGAYLGIWELIEVLAGAFILLAMVSMLMLIRKKMSRRYGLPFFPFLTAGYLMAVFV